MFSVFIVKDNEPYYLISGNQQKHNYNKKI